MLVELVISVDGNNQKEAQHKNCKFDQLFTPRSKIRWTENNILELMLVKRTSTESDVTYNLLKYLFFFSPNIFIEKM